MMMTWAEGGVGRWGLSLSLCITRSLSLSVSRGLVRTRVGAGGHTAAAGGGDVRAVGGYGRLGAQARGELHHRALGHEAAAGDFAAADAM
jgi:hypothetical protein